MVVKVEETTPLIKTIRPSKKFHPDFQQANNNRKCTDVICCAVFSVYLLGVAFVCVIAFVRGDPRRLIYPTDSDGKVCGVDYPSKNYLHYFDLTTCTSAKTNNPLAWVKHGLTCPTPQVCVTECTKENKNGTEASWNETVCVQGVVVSKADSKAEKEKLIKEELCAPYYLQSSSVFYRCLPDNADNISSLHIINTDGQYLTSEDIDNGEDAIELLVQTQNVSMKILEDLNVTWLWITILLSAAVFISIFYIVLARWMTFPLIILTELGVLASLGYGIYYMGNKYKYLNDTNTSVDITWNWSFAEFTNNKITWLVLCLLLSVVFLVLFFIVIYLWFRIRIACALIAEASRAVCQMPSSLIFPLLPWLLQLIWFGLCAAVLLYLVSSVKAEYQVSVSDPQFNLTTGDFCNKKTFTELYPNTSATCDFARYNSNAFVAEMSVFVAFGWLWGCKFLVAFTEISLAGAFASYYWSTRKPQDIPRFPVLSAMQKAVRYHTGSLALGSAILSVVTFIRVILEFVRNRIKAHPQSSFFKVVATCFRCCFWILEICIKFINKAAYIVIAVYGGSFCWSAKEAFRLLLRNPVRTIAVNGISIFVLFLGKLVIAGGIGVASFFVFDQYNAFQRKRLNYSYVPILICFVGAYLITSIFFKVYDMGIDTLFLCYLEDLERNNGSLEKPYFMTKKMKIVMDKQKQARRKKVT